MLSRDPVKGQLRALLRAAPHVPLSPESRRPWADAKISWAVVARALKDNCVSGQQGPRPANVPTQASGLQDSILHFLDS